MVIEGFQSWEQDLKIYTEVDLEPMELFEEVDYVLWGRGGFWK